MRARGDITVLTYYGSLTYTPMQNRTWLRTGNRKAPQIGRPLFAGSFALGRGRRLRSILTLICRNARSAVLVRTRPGLAKARAVKAVHPRVLSATRDNGTSAPRVGISHCRYSSRARRIPRTFESSGFFSNGREFQD